MSSIPEDIYLEILIRLPVKSIFRCKCVCKSWFSLISNPNFVKKHFDCTVQNNSRCSNFLFAERDAIYSISYDLFQSSLLSGIKVDDDDDDFDIVDNPFKSVGLSIGLVGSSCNGLVCLMFYEDYESNVRFYCIWNPATREFRKIPIPPENHCSDIWIRAFGYDCQNDDYKLFILSETHLKIFTLGLDRWKSIPVKPYDWWTDCDWDGVLVNGKLHWLAKLHRSRNIVSLDISNDIFESMQLPIPIEDTKNYLQHHGVLDGCLCLLVEILEDTVFDLWVMQDYGVPESWIKIHTITNVMITKRFNFNIMGNFKKNCQILFMGPCKLMLYDLNHGCVVKRIGFSSAVVASADTYLESLISLDSGTYMRRRQIEKRDKEEEEAYKGVVINQLLKPFVGCLFVRDGGMKHLTC